MKNKYFEIQVKIEELQLYVACRIPITEKTRKELWHRMCQDAANRAIRSLMGEIWYTGMNKILEDKKNKKI